MLEFFRRMADFYGMVELGESHPDLAKELYDSLIAAQPYIRIPQLRDLDLR